MDYKVFYREKNKSVQCIINYKYATGEWKQKTKQGFKTQKESKSWQEEMIEKLEKLEEQIASGNVLNEKYKGITFEKFKKVYTEHLKLYKAYNTQLNYKTTFNKFAKLNKKALEDITQLDIQIIVDGLVKKGLSRGTIMDNLKRLNTVFKAAVSPYKAIAENPLDVKAITLPKKKKTKKKIKALTKVQLDSLLEQISPENDYIITLIASTCGLRIGEILGLTWDNIDFKRKLIIVKRQWKEISKYDFGDLKSVNADREVPIPPKTVAALKQYKENLKVIPLDNRVVLDKNSKSTTSRLIKKYRKLGFNVSVHDLRHTYATMLIGNGVDFKTAAKFLGHNVQMTIKIYSHVNQDMIDAATLKLAEIF